MLIMSINLLFMFMIGNLYAQEDVKKYSFGNKRHESRRPLLDHNSREIELKEVNRNIDGEERKENEAEDSEEITFTISKVRRLLQQHIGKRGYCILEEMQKEYPTDYSALRTMVAEMEKCEDVREKGKLRIQVTNIIMEGNNRKISELRNDYMRTWDKYYKIKSGLLITAGVCLGLFLISAT